MVRSVSSTHDWPLWPSSFALPSSRLATLAVSFCAAVISLGKKKITPPPPQFVVCVCVVCVCVCVCVCVPIEWVACLFGDVPQFIVCVRACVRAYMRARQRARARVCVCVCGGHFVFNCGLWIVNLPLAQ